MARRYKYCIVPMCGNTTAKTPEKLFFDVPREAVERRRWCQIIGKENPPLSEKSVRHVCQDHFDLETDVCNMMQHKLMGSRMRLKKEVVPHRFDCQKDRSLSHTLRRRSGIYQDKKTKKEILDDAYQLYEELIHRKEKEKDQATKPPSPSKHRSRRVDHWSMFESNKVLTSTATASQEISTSNVYLAPNSFAGGELLNPVKTENADSLEGQAGPNSLGPQDQVSRFLTCEIFPAASATRIKEEPTDVFSSKDVETSEMCELITPDVPMYEQPVETLPFSMDIHIKQEVLLSDEEN